MLKIKTLPYSMEEYNHFKKETGFKDAMLPDITSEELLHRINDYYNENRKFVATESQQTI